MREGGFGGDSKSVMHASHRGGLGLIPGQDISVSSGHQVKAGDDLGQVSP
jgi:hypothetical protein